jgi:hypothetical protein
MVQNMVHHTLPNLHKKAANQSPQAWSLALLGMVLLGAAQPTLALSQPAPRLTTQISQPESEVPLTRPSRAVIRQVRRDLAERLNVQPRRLEMVGFSQEVWSDSCLGLAAYNERCAMATVEGWRLELSNGQRSWFYHTDMTAQVIKLESMDDTTLPPQVRERLIQTIVQQEKVPAASLIITESQPRTWDGCMGIFEPDQMCTMIAIPGYRAIVAGAEQSWVYHASEDGSRIVQNMTASGSRHQLVPMLMPTASPPYGQPIADVVFRTIESGSLAGVVSERFLTADGVIYKRTGQFGSVDTADAVVEKRLSQQQVQQFQQLLTNQKFRNLDGLRYLTSAAFADYPTITIQAMGSNVEYIDLEVDNMPQALQTVIQAWQQL